MIKCWWTNDRIFGNLLLLLTGLFMSEFFVTLWTIAGEGNGTPLQYSCLENPMDGGAWWAVVHGVAKSRTRLSDFTFTFHFHALQKEMGPHSSVLALKIPGTVEPGGLPSMGSHRVGHDWSDLAAAAAAWTIAHQAPLSRGLARQEHWSGLLGPPPGDLPNLWTEPISLVSPALAGMFFTTRAPNNWCFWNVVLEKTLEGPLNCKETQPVHPKGNQSWIFIGRTDAEAETPILWPPDANWLIWKDPHPGKYWGQEEKGTTVEEMVG